MSSMIEASHLSKQFGAIRAVDEVHLSVRRGEIFGFIGPNGAGKTTTIRMLAGLLLPSRGRIVIDGIDLARDPIRVKQRIGLIPDRPYLYEKLTGMEFMRFTADLYGVPAKEFVVRAEYWLKEFRLLDRGHELIGSYSHGMRQRLIMAAALLHTPRLLIVDEPMVGLDPNGIRRVRDLFRDLAGQHTTIFMSTHTLSLAESICDRIGIIHQGRVIAVGTMAELREKIQTGEADLEAIFLQVTEPAEPA